VTTYNLLDIHKPSARTSYLQLYVTLQTKASGYT